MALPSSGQIGISDVRTETGRTTATGIDWIKANTKPTASDFDSLHGRSYYQSNKDGNCNTSPVPTGATSTGNIQCQNCTLSTVNCANCDAQSWLQAGTNCACTYNCTTNSDQTYNCNCDCACDCACDCTPADCVPADCVPADCNCACACACDCFVCACACW